MARLNLRLLEVFRAVYEAQSVTIAASHLCVSQPAVSKGLAQLEAELGFPVFSRSHGKLNPTPDGTRLYEESARLFAQVALFQDSLNDLSNGRLGKIVIGGIPTLAGSVLTRAGQAILSQRPMAKISICAAQASAVMIDASHHRIDFGLTHSLPDDDTIVAHLMGESEIVAAVPADHPLAGRATLEPGDFEEAPIIMLDGGSPPSHLVRDAFDRNGASIHMVMEVNSTAIAYAGASDGLGIALIDPWSALYTPSARVKLVRFVPQIPLRIYAVHSKDRPLSRLAIAMLGEISAQFKTMSRQSPFVRVPSDDCEAPWARSQAGPVLHAEHRHELAQNQSAAIA